MLNDNIRILGHDFVKNNKNKAKLMINNKKYSLREFIDNIQFTDNKIKINIILSKDIANISYMFMNSAKLLEISTYDDIMIIEDLNSNENGAFFQHNLDYDEDNFNNIYNNFYNDNLYQNCSESTKSIKIDESYCHSAITDIKDIYDNIINYQNNYLNMSKMFYNCSSLTTLNDIFKKNINNVASINGMFYNCSSLSSLPDISKWNINNVTDMSNIFYNCSSLSSSPDLSNWNTNNIINMCRIFYNCFSLLSLPDISKWNIDNAIDMSDMFKNCISLISSPDLSSWNPIHSINMSGMFYNCRSLSFLPNIYIKMEYQKC